MSLSDHLNITNRAIDVRSRMGCSWEFSAVQEYKCVSKVTFKTSQRQKGNNTLDKKIHKTFYC